MSERKRGAPNTRYLRRLNADAKPQGPSFRWEAPGRERAARLVEIPQDYDQLRFQRRTIIN